MKKFLLLLVGVLFALSAKADYYYLVGDAVGDWNSKSYEFTEIESGIYELQYSGDIEASKAFKINNGAWDKGVNIGPTSSSDDDKKITLGTAKTYLNENKDNGGFYLTQKVSNPYFVLNTNKSELTVYNRKPLEAHVPSGNYCFFLNTENWTTPKAHVWNDGNNTTWSGNEMRQYKETKLYLWEASDYSIDWTPNNIIFNNNGSDQTDNLTFKKGAVYNPDGSLQSTFSNTYYFDIAGSAITTTPTLSIGWATVLGVQTGKSGVYKFDLTTSIPTNYWEVSFTDGTNTYDSRLIVAENVYKVEGTDVVNKGEYSKYGASATDYTIYFDAAGTAWDGATLTYADGQPTVTGAAVEGKAGVYSFSFESTLTESQMSVKVANSDKSFSAATFVNGHIYKLYRGALTDAGEYTAEYTVTTPVESTIYFTTEGTGWTGVKIHIWDNFNNDLTGTWGSTAMTKVEGTDNVWKFTIPVEYMKVLCGIIFTDGYKFDKHQTNTLYADDFQAGHLYKINANWTVASQGLYVEPGSSELTIGFAGNFSNEKGIWWLKPTDDNAPKFTRQSGDIYVLDLGKLDSDWDFTTATEFKIFNITGDLASAQSGWGQGYGVNSGELYAGVPYKMVQSNSETSNIKVAEAITAPYLTLDVSTWTVTVTSGSGTIVVPDYVYEISGTFNGWQPPVGTASEKRPYQLTREVAADGKVTYEITIPGTMKAGAEFKICNMSISDDAWGAAYGTTYTTTNTVATRDELTPGTAYQMRRTNVPGENVIINETVVNPKFVLDPLTMKVTVVSTYEAPKDFAYWLYGTMYDGNWNPYKLNQQPDGTWTATFDVRSNAQFGIRITEYSDESGNNQIDGGRAKGWIYCADGQADHAVVDNHYVINIGQPTKCVVKDGNAGKDFVTASGNDTPFSGTTQLTVVFDPKNMTIVFYNPAALQATITQIAEGTANYEDLGQAVNSTSLDVDLTNYSYPVAASYSLAVGNTVLATATTAVNKVTFNDLPYYSSMELSLIPAGATTGVPLNVTAPALNSEDMFNLSVNKLLYVTDAADTTGDLVLTCTSTGSLVYNKPAIVATWGDYEFDTTVEWSKDGFTAIVKDVVPTSNGAATEERTITITFNPIFPFAVTNATNLSGASLLAESNHYLAEFGGPREVWTVTTNADLTVSGVEGVAVENEEAPVEYYNLQGQRVNGDLAPGIYIRRQGNTVTKVRI